MGLGEIFSSVAGPIVSSAVQLFNAKKDREAAVDLNQANIGHSNAQMAFQKEMSDTSHQREVADLKKAGLNPVLSANSGASTPVGSQPTMVALPSPGRGVNFLSNAIEVGRFRKELEEADSRIDVNRAHATDLALSANQRRTGTSSRLLGTDLTDFVRRLMARGYNSAKSSYGKLKLNSVPKRDFHFDEKKTRSERLNTFYAD